MKEREIKLLFYKYLNGEATIAEIQILCDYFGIDEHQVVLEQLIRRYLDTDIQSTIHADYTEAEKIASDRWLTVVDHTRRSTLRRLYWGRYAAAMLILFCSITGLYVYLHHPYSKMSGRVSSNLSTDVIIPGSNKATLTLADGAELVLDGIEGGIFIGDEVTYSDGSKITDAQSPILALSTPKGGQYEVTLSDGTKVYLNAMTKLSYPQQFANDERKVHLIGEAYFEVSHDRHRPFIVTTDRQEIKVLGTVFNTSAYPDDDEVTTTLLEGKVKLDLPGNTSSPRYSVFLKPNEQGVSNDVDIQVSKVDANKVVAWKHGDFVFNDEKLESIMKKIERWYDVEIRYENIQEMSHQRFSGSISRFSNVEDVLQMLQLTDALHFKVEGRRVTIMR